MWLLSIELSPHAVASGICIFFFATLWTLSVSIYKANKEEGKSLAVYRAFLVTILFTVTLMILLAIIILFSLGYLSYLN